MWLYRGEPFTSEMIGDHAGFVYAIELPDGRKYIGKKGFWKQIRRPPLKGRKRVRICKVESDWARYYSSSEAIKAIVAERGTDGIHREIVRLCRNKAEMAYFELKEQVDNDVLLSDRWLNNILNIRLNGNALRPGNRAGAE